MAKNSRVGSLYYEIILDPNKFVKGATKVTSEQRKMSTIIKRENDAIDAKKSRKDRYEDDMQFIKDLVMQKEISVQQGTQ